MKRTMDNLFTLSLCFLVYWLQHSFFPSDPFTMYLISAIPAGWLALNRSKTPRNDTDRIIREIRLRHSDFLVELMLFVFRKSVKLLAALAIGWALVASRIIDIVIRCVKAVRFSGGRSNA